MVTRYRAPATVMWTIRLTNCAADASLELGARAVTMVTRAPARPLTIQWLCHVSGSNH